MIMVFVRTGAGRFYILEGCVWYSKEGVVKCVITSTIRANTVEMYVENGVIYIVV